jgi:hypothetical protein
VSLVSLALAVTLAHGLAHGLVVAQGPFVAEGLALSARGELLVSGVYAHTVVEFHDGKPRAFLKPGKFAPVGGLFGMGTDPQRNRLWIAETSGPGVPGSSGTRRTGVLEVELSSGKILSRYFADTSTEDHFIGDVTVTSAGAVYATDGAGGVLYRVSLESRQLVVTATTELKSLQGAVPAADGLSLIVSSYGKGLHLFKGATFTQIRGTPQGIDGLARCGDTLIVTQNGTDPYRILQLTLSADETSVESTRVLASGPPTAEDISLGLVQDTDYIYVRSSQWAAFDEKGALKRQPSAAELGVIPGLQCGQHG